MDKKHEAKRAESDIELFKSIIRKIRCREIVSRYLYLAEILSKSS